MRATDYYFKCEADKTRWVCMRSTSRVKARRTVLACLFSYRFGISSPIKRQFPSLESRMAVLENRFGYRVETTTKELYELNYNPEDDE